MLEEPVVLGMPEILEILEMLEMPEIPEILEILEMLETPERPGIPNIPETARIVAAMSVSTAVGANITTKNSTAMTTRLIHFTLFLLFRK